MNLRPRSVRVRLTLWYSFSLALVLLVYAAVAWIVMRHSALGGLDDALREDSEKVAEIVGAGPDGTLVLPTFTHELDESLPWFEVWTRDGRLLLSHPVNASAPIVAPPEAAGLAALLAGGADSVKLANGRPVRRWATELELGGQRVCVVIARSERRMRTQLWRLLGALGVAIPLGALLAGAGGYALARRALAPVDRIASRAATITADRLAERLPVDNPGDELGRLATTCNEMIARLEQSFAQLRRFTADASHELRTPLTAVRTVGEVGLREPRTAEEYREIIGSMLEEIGRLSRLVEELLTLSRADAGHLKLALEECDLAALARDARERLLVLADEKGQAVAVEAPGSLPIRADRVLVRQAIGNLLGNAISHSPMAAPIRIVVRGVNGEAIVEVIDRGPGIAREHQERIFERFYRIDPARARGGAGLGLALARSTAELHGGRIELDSEPGKGSTFRIVLPRPDLTRAFVVSSRARRSTMPPRVPVAQVDRAALS